MPGKLYHSVEWPIVGALARDLQARTPSIAGLIVLKFIA